MRKRASHIFDRDKHDHYVEEQWCSERLFDEEPFKGPILDPCCGWGRILDAARRHGYRAIGSDIVHRGENCDHVVDFLSIQQPTLDWFIEPRAIVSNPPFDQIEDCVYMAMDWLELGNVEKIAFVFPLRRLPAAHWLIGTPLKRIWLMSPRPSMPTGAYVKAGGKVGGGTQDYCWLVWEHGYLGPPETVWLFRDKEKQTDAYGS